MFNLDIFIFLTCSLYVMVDVQIGIILVILLCWSTRNVAMLIPL